MHTDQLINDIRDLNVSYLLLAQQLIRTDKAQALYRLGVSEPVAELIDQLTPQQVLRAASRSHLLCTARFDDELVWGLLSDGHLQPSAGGMHAAVLMAGHNHLAS